MAAAVAAVPGPARDPQGALWVARAPGSEGAREAAVAPRPEGAREAAAVAAVAEWAVALVVTQGGRDGRRI